MNTTIPPSRQEDALYLIWRLATTIESKCGIKDILDKTDVTCAYNFLNEVGYTDLRPRWEKKC